MDRLWISISIVWYLGGVGLALIALLRRQPPPHSIIFGLLLVGFLAQSTGLYLRGMEVQSCPIGNPFEVLQFISWSVMLLFFLTGPMFRLSLFGAASANLAVCISLISLLFPQWDEGRRGYFGSNPWIETHAAIALFSYGVFGLLAAISVLYLLQNHGLRTKRFSSFLKFFPSLFATETVLHRLILIAFLTYSSAVLIGGYYYVNNPDAIQFGKLSFTIILWTGYFLLWFLNQASKLYAHRLAWTCIALFLFALLTLWPVEVNRDPKPQTLSSLHSEPGHTTSTIHASS
ncbi:MAG: cytochrome c biogenesis protein CcsA [Opitutales bacterium]|nr:cytochrome c biogenesis protein CcsA [Opitutales bacterium]